MAGARDQSLGSGEIYLSNRALIERTIALVCTRRRLSPEDADEFASEARFHLIKDDYAVLRAFQGRSWFQTFLAAVLAHLLQDWRNARWGKWRPSAEARRLGPLAVRLETLTVRDGLSFDEACEVLRTNLRVEASGDELEAVWRRLPARARRSFAGEEPLVQLATQEAPPDAGLARALAARSATRARAALQNAIAALPPSDRLILGLRFEDGLRLREIATLVNMEQKRLYRHVELLVSNLRRAVEGAGVSRDEVFEAMEAHGFDAADVEGDQTENRGEVRLLTRDERSRPAAGG